MRRLDVWTSVIPGVCRCAGLLVYSLTHSLCVCAGLHLLDLHLLLFTLSHSLTAVLCSLSVHLFNVSTVLSLFYLCSISVLSLLICTAT